MNKILFLYTDASEKRLLEFCKEALKTLLRKFRKSIEIISIQIDFSLSCRTMTEKLLSEKISCSDGILFFGKLKTFSDKKAFSDIFGIYAAQHFSSSKCILYPVTSKTMTTADCKIIVTDETLFSSFHKISQIALNTVTQKNPEFLLCTDTSSDNDKIFFDEISTYLSASREFKTEHFNFDEMILSLTKEIPAQDIIICSEDKVKLISALISSQNRFPFEYTVFHSDNSVIYKGRNRSLPFDETFSYANTLFALANMVEKECGLKNAGNHFRKAVTLALKTHYSEDIASFHNQLLFEINVPLRNRTVNPNENNN